MSDAVSTDSVVLDDVLFRFAGRDAFELSVPDLTVRRGEQVAIVGPSGCGKTTLLRLISGALSPTSGSVRTLGRDLRSLAEGARRGFRVREIGIVSQSLALMDYLDAMDNILLAARLAGVEADKRLRARATDLADRVGITHALGKRPSRLSQGERQRVAICRAILTEPPLLLCDEPTGNLDPARSRSVLALMLREAAAIDAAVVVVTHDEGLLGEFARVVQLGGVVDKGGPP